MAVRSFRRFIAALVVVGACWAGCWWYSWQVALLAMFANLYLVLAFVFAVFMYPPRED